MLAISDAIDTINMKPIKDLYKIGGTGRAPFCPGMMLKGILLNNIEGNMSTRKMEYNFRFNLRYRALMGGHTQDHSTAASFINRIGELMDHIFWRYCASAGRRGC